MHKLTLAALAALTLSVAGCGSVARQSGAELGIKDVPPVAEKPRRNYEAESTKLYEAYPHWGANRKGKNDDGKEVLIKPASIRGTHPRPVEDDFFYFSEDTGMIGQHPSSGDPGRHHYGRDSGYPLFFRRHFFPRYSWWVWSW